MVGGCIGDSLEDLEAEVEVDGSSANKKGLLMKVMLPSLWLTLTFSSSFLKAHDIAFDFFCLK